MQQLRFSLPQKFVEPKEFGLDSNPKSVELWLQELPLTMTEQSAEEVISLLVELNKSQLEPTVRYQHLTTILPVATKLVESLRTVYTYALLPLSPKNTAKHQLAAMLSNELAFGFRIITHEISKGDTADQEDKPLLATCLYLAIQQLTKVLIEHYLVYFPEPAKLWGEINRLYACAEKHDLQHSAVPHKNDSKIKLIIADIYKCALLTAIANPYQMMQGEVLALKKELFRYIDKCKLLKKLETQSDYYFVVDIKHDTPPRFVLTQLDIELLEPRYIDLQKIMGELKALYTRTTISNNSDATTNQQRLDFSHRTHRDMIKRVIDTLERHSERQYKRESIPGKLDITLGLSASHYHSSDESPFTPELDEVSIHNGKPTSPLDSLELVPVDFSNWNEPDTSSSTDNNLDLSDASASDQNNALEIWKKVFSSHAGSSPFGGQEDHYNDMKKLHATSSWTKKNQSKGGMCIFCRAEQTLPLRVGEVISYTKSQNDPWQVSVIRWLRVHENKTLEMGIKHVMDEAIGVACRSIKGIGEGSEYFRCLLANADIQAQDNSLMVPNAIFDVDSELAINLGSEIHYLRLQKQLLATRSVAQFLFTVIDRPSSEARLINELKALL